MAMCEVLDKVENRGIQKGIEQGIEQGMQQGIEQGIEQVALNMDKKGYSVQEIAELTGRDTEEIKELLQKTFA